MVRRGEDVKQVCVLCGDWKRRGRSLTDKTEKLTIMGMNEYIHIAICNQWSGGASMHCAFYYINVCV